MKTTLLPPASHRRRSPKRPRALARLWWCVALCVALLVASGAAAETRRRGANTGRGRWRTVGTRMLRPHELGRDNALAKGKLEITSHGSTLHLRSFEPVKRGGRLHGVRVREWSRSLPATTAERELHKAQSSYDKLVDMLENRWVLGTAKRSSLQRAAVDALLSSAPDSAVAAYRTAMKSAAESVGDKYTRYYDPKAYNQRELHTRGREISVGAVLAGKGQGKLRVSRTHPGSAAHGVLLPGDKLLAVNGRNFGTVKEANRALRGADGSTTRVTIERGGQRREVTLRRTEFQIKQVEHKLRSDGIGVVKLARFTEGCAAEIDQAIGELKRQNRGTLRGLVLDLRKNPGGRSKEATALANLFIRSGDLVRYEGYNAETHRAEPSKAKYCDVPLAVLVDKKSASASERLAGVLKQHCRATIVGERTFGKGIRQSTFKLPDGGALKVTTARMLLPDPNGGPELYYHGRGLDPHHQVRSGGRDGAGDPVMTRAIRSLTAR